MAKPRVFVSSTFYDMRHIRSSLEGFISSLGYEAILSEKGSIAYDPGLPLDESCYREAEASDIFVLLIGGRYGSEVSETRSSHAHGFYERYESITKAEYESAITKEIPTYILIEREVYSEYETYQSNKNNEHINYVQVDSVNVFKFIDEILNKPRNNPIFQFDKYAELQDWLRDQWAGHYKELLTKTRHNRELASLTAQVSDLSEINQTLRSYLEKIISKLAPDESKDIISTESERLDKARKLSVVEKNDFAEYLVNIYKISYEQIMEELIQANSLEEFLSNLKYEATGEGMLAREGILRENWKDNAAVKEINRMRKQLGLSELKKRGADKKGR